MDLNAEYVLSVAVWNVPELVIGVVGIVLALVRSIPGRARGLLIGGSATTIFAGIASIAFSLWVPSILREPDDISDYERVYLIVGLVFGVLQMAGIGLLIAAALANRPPGYDPAPGYGPRPEAPSGYAPPGQAPPSYPPSGYAPPGQVPPAGQWGPPPGSPGSFG